MKKNRDFVQMHIRFTGVYNVFVMISRHVRDDPFINYIDLPVSSKE